MLCQPKFELLKEKFNQLQVSYQYLHAVPDRSILLEKKGLQRLMLDGGSEFLYYAAPFAALSSGLFVRSFASLYQFVTHFELSSLPFLFLSSSFDPTTISSSLFETIPYLIMPYLLARKEWKKSPVSLFRRTSSHNFSVFELGKFFVYLYFPPFMQWFWLMNKVIASTFTKFSPQSEKSKPTE